MAEDYGRVAGEALTGSHSEEQLGAWPSGDKWCSWVVDRFGLLQWATWRRPNPRCYCGWCDGARSR